MDSTATRNRRKSTRARGDALERRRIATIRAELDATPEGVVSLDEQAERINRALGDGLAGGHRASGANLPIQLTSQERRLLRGIGRETAMDILDGTLVRSAGPDVQRDALLALEDLAEQATLFAAVWRAGREGVLPLRHLPAVLRMLRLYDEDGGPAWERRAVASLRASAGVVA